MKPPKKFHVDVDGVGRFVFKWRDMAAQIDIENVISRYTGGQVKPSPNLYWLASTAALFEVLMIEGPDGWSFNALNPKNPAVYAQLQAITGAHSTTEDTFLGAVPTVAAAAGEGGSAGDAVRIPSPLQPGTD
ncbi:hypothetical protein [Nevskia sp.]|uniref:hypothetical protein n=1 Tax=Nevskia sp. TaxID=1929292 RepID=UPI0025F47ED8|nr:hypothetical protein [Nevskia sp.]